MTRNVWVLHIAHKYGDGFWVFTTEDQARRRVEAWVSQYWQQETGEPLPDLTGEDLVEAYFEKVAARESYRIEEAGLDEF